MGTIKQLSGIITSVRDISPSAREYVITPSEPFPFIAGAFVNVFVEHDGKTIRRAFSMSSSDTNDHSISLSIRLSPNGELTPILWSKDFTGTTVKLMGPLGRNTADKLLHDKVFLFGFGVGAGVVKSLADHIARRDTLQSLTIVTGNRSIAEILHKDYFDALAESNKKVSVKYVVSDVNQSVYPTGHIQDHLQEYDFSNTDVYMCGQGVACTELEETIKTTDPHECSFFVEAFH